MIVPCQKFNLVELGCIFKPANVHFIAFSYRRGIVLKVCKIPAAPSRFALTYAPARAQKSSLFNMKIRQNLLPSGFEDTP